MIVVTLQREKCIGCNYCVEFDSEHFRMSKKDGKTILLRSSEKKGFHTLKINSNRSFKDLIKAKKSCPVKIIHISYK